MIAVHPVMRGRGTLQQRQCTTVHRSFATWASSSSLRTCRIPRGLFGRSSQIGRRAVGGRLYLTDSRLIFQPHRFDAALNGQSWSSSLEQVREVRTELSDGGLLTGGVRTRLLIRTDGSTDLFVVHHVDDAVQRIREAVVRLSQWVGSPKCPPTAASNCRQSGGQRTAKVALT